MVHAGARAAFVRQALVLAALPSVCGLVVCSRPDAAGLPFTRDGRLGCAFARTATVQVPQKPRLCVVYRFYRTPPVSMVFPPEVANRWFCLSSQKGSAVAISRLAERNQTLGWLEIRPPPHLTPSW